MKAIFFCSKVNHFLPWNKVLQIIVDGSILFFVREFSRLLQKHSVSNTGNILIFIMFSLEIWISIFFQSLFRWFTFKLSTKMFFLEYLLRFCIRLKKHIRSIQISFDHCLRKNIQIAVGIVISFTVRSNGFFVRYQLICAMFIVCSHASGGFCKLMNQQIFIDIISVRSSKMTPSQRPTCIISFLHFNDCIEQDAIEDCQTLLNWNVLLNKFTE